MEPPIPTKKCWAVVTRKPVNYDTWFPPSQKHFTIYCFWMSKPQTTWERWTASLQFLQLHKMKLEHPGLELLMSSIRFPPTHLPVQSQAGLSSQSWHLTPFSIVSNNWLKLNRGNIWTYNGTITTTLKRQHLFEVLVQPRATWNKWGGVYIQRHRTIRNQGFLVVHLTYKAAWFTNRMWSLFW